MDSDKKFQEPLHHIPIERWPELQSSLLADSPRSLPGYNVLETQKRWREEGHNVQVYCPFGKAENGFVAICDNPLSYEIVIQYPKDDISILEEALRRSSIIDWGRNIRAPFTAYHVISVLEKIVRASSNMEMMLIASDTFIVERGSSLFEDVCLPPDCTFNLLPMESAELVDSKWPHRYPNSTAYFELLIRTKCGYGLFKNGDLICWIFISEWGYLTHLYTMEEHRKSGYAGLVLKLISNLILKKGMGDVIAFCVKGNHGAYKLYEKLGFRRTEEIAWCFTKNKS